MCLLWHAMTDWKRNEEDKFLLCMHLPFWCYCRIPWQEVCAMGCFPKLKRTISSFDCCSSSRWSQLVTIAWCLEYLPLWCYCFINHLLLYTISSSSTSNAGLQRHLNSLPIPCKSFQKGKSVCVSRQIISFKSRYEDGFNQFTEFVSTADWASLLIDRPTIMTEAQLSHEKNWNTVPHIHQHDIWHAHLGKMCICIEILKSGYDLQRRNMSEGDKIK